MKYQVDNKRYEQQSVVNILINDKAIDHYRKAIEGSK
jgi:hypothetical protein